MSMYTWNGKNPVHGVSTADSTATNTVKRKQKDTYVEVPCPASYENKPKKWEVVIDSISLCYYFFWESF